MIDYVDYKNFKKLVYFSCYEGFKKLTTRQLLFWKGKFDESFKTIIFNHSARLTVRNNKIDNFFINFIVRWVFIYF
jgi:hypothetical protein